MLFLEIYHDHWYSFEDFGGTPTTVSQHEYDPVVYGHINGAYTGYGAGGVQFTKPVVKETGWGWLWKDPASPDENLVSQIYDTHQECFEDACRLLFLECEPEDRLGDLLDWQQYAQLHGLDTTFIERTL